MKCLNCDKEFNSQRKTSKYCSLKCRVAYSRKDSVTQNEEVSVTNPLINGVSVTSPQEEKKVSVTTIKMDEMTDELLWEEADRMAIREYLARGYFGGKRNYKTQTITYFPFEAVKSQFFKFLKNGQKEMKVSNVEDVSIPSEQQWHEVGKCENCFKNGQLTEMEVPTYDKESGDMLQMRKKICKRCQSNLNKLG